LKDVRRYRVFNERLPHHFNFDVASVATGKRRLRADGKIELSHELLQLVLQALAVQLHDSNEAALGHTPISCDDGSALVIGTAVECTQGLGRHLRGVIATEAQPAGETPALVSDQQADIRHAPPP
jgi:hypothetical protein